MELRAIHRTYMIEPVFFPMKYSIVLRKITSRLKNIHKLERTLNKVFKKIYAKKYPYISFYSLNSRGAEKWKNFYDLLYIYRTK